MSTNKNTHQSILHPTHTRAGDAAHDARQPRTDVDNYVDKEYNRVHGPLSLGEKVAIGVAGAAVVAGLVYGGVHELGHKQPDIQTTATTQDINNQKH